MPRYSLFFVNFVKDHLLLARMNQELLNYISGFVTERRLDLFSQVLDKRTRYLTVVLEDIYQSQNASAVLRSCDCFGVQDVHIIENRNEYTINPDVTQGSNKWLNLRKYSDKDENTLEAFEILRQKGYRIVATSPHHKSASLEKFDLSKGKSAIVFGTELNGLSETALNNADEYLFIPMHGFTESLNISVSAAIILHHLTSKLRETNIDWKLTNQEKMEIKLNWLRQSIKRADLHEKEFIRKRTK